MEITLDSPTVVLGKGEPILRLQRVSNFNSNTRPLWGLFHYRLW